MKALIYTKARCGHCTAAKNLMNNKGILYTEMYLDNQESIQAFITEHPEKRSMPQIWIDNEYIGGYEKLKEKLL
jgi:alkyl hydroperoxide reductase subunit F|tara:strand:+ start:1278 stop:1499 length:222 start_codon:yes stop_codon:yes gene_type:complete